MPRILVSGAPNGCDNYINAILAAGGQPFASYLPPVDGSYDALLLTGTRAPRGGGNGNPSIGHLLKQSGDEGSLAGPRGAADDE